MRLPIDTAVKFAETSVGVQSDHQRICLSVSEVSAALGISKAHAYELVKSGVTRHFALGRRIIIPRDALLDAVRARQSTPSSN
jgi:excisionase family DNA binding protein